MKDTELARLVENNRRQRLDSDVLPMEEINEADYMDIDILDDAPLEWDEDCYWDVHDNRFSY